MVRLPYMTPNFRVRVVPKVDDGFLGLRVLGLRLGFRVLGVRVYIGIREKGFGSCWCLRVCRCPGWLSQRLQYIGVTGRGGGGRRLGPRFLGVRS